jgi:hypothetical protein
MSHLRDFWKWLVRRGVINHAQMPHFPKIPFKLGYRKVADWEKQTKIIAEIV